MAVAASTQRRFTDKPRIDPGSVRELAADHPAMIEEASGSDEAGMRRIAAMAMPDVKPAPVSMTDMPETRAVDPRSLLIDESYQRNLSQRSVKLIRRIVANWDWRSFKPPVCGVVGDALHVIDGQHTAIAAASHPQITEIPVIIRSGKPWRSSCSRRPSGGAMDADHRMAALEEENASLRERVMALEAALMGEWTPPIEFGLTAQEGRVFGVLLKRQQASKDQIMAALYGNRLEEAEMKIVDVFICKIRKKLGPFGIVIETLWGRGYALEAESRRRLVEEFGAQT